MKPEDQTPHRHAHRYPGIRKRRVRKPLVELTPEPESSDELKLRAPPDSQQTLRQALANGPVSLGELRERYKYDPVMLLRETVGQFPDVYREVEDCGDGHPGLELREDAPPLSDSLDRRKLVALIGEAGACGIYLSTLHRATGFSSQHIEELLAELPGIECEVRNGRPLYRSKSDGEPEHVQASTLDELESARDRLLQVLGTSQRMSNWLVGQCGFDHGTLSIVLAKYKDDFLVKEVNTGVSSYLMISAVMGGGLHPKPALSETPVGAVQPFSAPQANQPPEPIDAVLGPDVADRLRWRPASSGMGRRRGGPLMQLGRERRRHPLVELP